MTKIFKFGLKLWSINDYYIKDAEKLYRENLFNYIELYIVPSSFSKYISLWKNLNIPFVLHAPHYYGGMNLAEKNNKDQNQKLINETLKWSYELNPKYIIFHPGINGVIEETINILQNNYDDRFLIENMPYYALSNIGICKGNSFEEIKKIIDNLNIGFCFDIGHAIYSANAKNIDPIVNIKNFFKLKPKMYHLSDGDYNKVLDLHLNYGKGNFPIIDILNLIPANAIITNETKKDSKENLNDFIEDIMYIKNIYAKKKNN